ncbi:RNA polymerase sigma factor [Nocardia farcinica]|uniref:RNA polymerase sigma factor n=1 Tax=Nocardia farcinica TaxID=37329 RepID=UPI001895097E|nr:DUF6596 domain-containing protein [Nocardia farcinica]MBF6519317.1 RNA polymerase sigma factor [Nocardia farcinica]
MKPDADTLALEDLLRTVAPQVLGVLVRRFGDFDTAEDAVQEALLAAATQWREAGIPENPRGWLIQVAQRRYVDTVRAESARRRRETAVFEREVPDAAAVDRDDTLAMFFLCCHPALPTAGAIALTLRAVGGLTTAEIANAFLVPEATMAQRISRTKKRLAAVQQPFARPDRAQWRQRVGTVLHVLYLIFTEGHAPSSGDRPQRADLSAEAIRLTRAMHRLLPEDTEVAGLLALMLLTDARRAARTGPHGELVPLDRQDRARWDRRQIMAGIRLVTATLAHGLSGPYQVQAAIAAVHAQAPRAEDTDWPKILALYDVLQRLSPGPVVALNRAVAVAMVHGPEAGLAITETLAADLAGSHRLSAVRAHLLDMAGADEDAVAAYTDAARRTTSIPERDYLTLRAAELRHRRRD